METKADLLYEINAMIERLESMPDLTIPLSNLDLLGIYKMLDRIVRL